MDRRVVLRRGKKIIGGKYTIIRKIGSGSFGDVFLGELENGDPVAIKMEKAGSRHPQLEYEYKLYRILRGGTGIASVKYFGTENGYNALVLDLLGKSLEDLFIFCGRKFSMKTILMLFNQIISRLEFLHTKHFIHRDVKPDNFLMGIGSSRSMLFIIDFGLAKKYRDPRTRVHIVCRTDKPLTGTARYASINAHLGFEQSRRDDLEAVAYMLLYFNNGSLPWQGLKGINKKQKCEAITEMKTSMKVSEVCKGLPDEFRMFLAYSRSLGFIEQPDYCYWRTIFRLLFRNLNYTYDDEYDWVVKQKKHPVQGNGDTKTSAEIK